METGKKTPAAPAVSVDGKKIIAFLDAIKGEFRKIEWTERDELKSYAKIILGSMAVLGAGIYGVDVAMQGALSAVNLLVKFFTG